MLNKTSTAWDRLPACQCAPTGWKPIPRSVWRLLAAAMLCLLVGGCGPWIGG